jgi:hypothetical protein
VSCFGQEPEKCKHALFSWRTVTVRLHLNGVSLAFQLVHINQPDLVVFVGEALVGNEAVDQLSKFNQAMVDYAVVCPRPWHTKPRYSILSPFGTLIAQRCTGRQAADNRRHHPIQV